MKIVLRSETQSQTISTPKAKKTFRASGLPEVSEDEIIRNIQGIAFPAGYQFSEDNLIVEFVDGGKGQVHNLKFTIGENVARLYFTRNNNLVKIERAYNFAKQLLADQFPQSELDALLAKPRVSEDFTVYES